MPLSGGRFVSRQVGELAATSSQRGFPSRNVAGIGATAWTPMHLGDLLLWLDAADTATITSSGSPAKVSQWNDKSGNGYHAVQATAAAQPVTGSATQNGLNVLTFESNDGMSIASFDLTKSGQAWSAFAVFNAVRDGTNRIVLEHSTNFNNNAGAWVVSVLNTSDANPQAFHVSKNGIPGQSTPQYTNIISASNTSDVVHAVVARHDGRVASEETDGVFDGATMTVRSYNFNTDNNNINDTLFVGARNNASNFVTGPVCELGVVRRKINDNEMRLLADYLRAKWATP